VSQLIVGCHATESHSAVTVEHTRRWHKDDDARPNRIHLAKYHQSRFCPFHGTAEKNFDKAIPLFAQGNSTVRKKAFCRNAFFLRRRNAWSRLPRKTKS
jgi:hypothetical protein